MSHLIELNWDLFSLSSRRKKKQTNQEYCFNQRSVVLSTLSFLHCAKIVILLDIIIASTSEKKIIAVLKLFICREMLKSGKKRNQKIFRWILLPLDQTLTNGWQSFIQLTIQIEKGVYPELEFPASLYLRVSGFVYFKFK